MRYSNETYRIFPGRKILKKYLEGRATNREQYIVELWEQSHPEASRIMASLSSGEMSLDQIPTFKPPFLKRYFNLVVTVITVLSITVVALLNWPEGNKTHYVRHAPVEVTRIETIVDNPGGVSENEKFVAPKLENTSTEVETVSDVKSREEGFFSSAFYRKFVKLDKKPARTLKTKENESKVRSRISYPYFFAHNHKVRDYSERQARLANEAKQHVNSIHDPLHSAVVQQFYQNVPYYQRLEEGMGFLRAGKNKSAIGVYRTILDQYPEDENALFYAGLASYRSAQFAKAQSLLTRAINQKGGVFYEESLWYLALSLDELDNPKSDSILCIIQQYDSFYEEQSIQKIGVCE